MVTLADETTDDEDLIDLTCAKQQRRFDSSFSQQQHSNHRLHPLQHSPKVTFFDTGDGSASRGEEENSDDGTDHITMLRARNSPCFPHFPLYRCPNSLCEKLDPLTLV